MHFCVSTFVHDFVLLLMCVYFVARVFVHISSCAFVSSNYSTYFHDRFWNPILTITYFHDRFWNPILTLFESEFGNMTLDRNCSQLK
ncbi:hypothetical protein MIMGU_mgv11b016130mg [Erythranthe guttata]|uniref:Uncharacterized protein n=1 Tax=Erythranthe guttata TaxID=4155 RepID=A0A022RP47_ERYGU|nr:hypothetical protein MIMGU_mgv11b016130mg [Erythranthe guttata]